MKIKVVVLIISFMFIIIARPVWAADKPAGDGPAKVLFEEKCGYCHPLSRSLNKHKTKKEWQKTVERMQRKKPDLISAEAAAAITGYLAETQGQDKKKKSADFGIISGFFAFFAVCSSVGSGYLMQKKRLKIKQHHFVAKLTLVLVLIHALYQIFTKLIM